MSEYCQEALSCRPDDLRSALSIHTKKITDSCRDKDCIEDLRVYLSRESQKILDSAASAKVRCGELLHTAVEVSPVAFHQNHFCIDLTFYYRITVDALIGNCRPATIYGLSVFSKRAVLCGESSGAHIFSSCTENGYCTGTMPTAVVEVLDPMILSSKTACVCTCDNQVLNLPPKIQGMFEEELVTNGSKQNLYVTLGQFSIIRLERDAQIIVPILDYAIPSKECCDAPGGGEDPCQIFDRIPFPAIQFTPTGCPQNHPDECDCCQKC